MLYFLAYDEERPMSLYDVPVSVDDLLMLQQGLQFFTNTAEASPAEVAAINTPGDTQSVLTYAASLLEANVSLSQVAMGVSAFAEEGTIAVGNSTTPNTLAFLSTQFLPGQVAYANAHGLNPTIYAAQSLGLALADTTNFGVVMNEGVSTLASETGVHADAINGWLNYWTEFYTTNPSALHGLTVAKAAFGATLGDAVGTVILNNTSGPAAMLHTEVDGDTIVGAVANALIDIAEGSYKVGIPLVGIPGSSASLGEPGHTALQGENIPS
jgi:hypothetical protein